MTTNNPDWWSEIESGETSLQQGDFIPGCYVPILPADFGLIDISKAVPGAERDFFVGIEQRNVIVLTQTCDLENNKAKSILVCPAEIIRDVPSQLGEYENIRRNRVEGNLLLAPFPPNTAKEDHILVDFREQFSLPVAYVSQTAALCGSRYRLNSPYCEYLAQSFAHYFMRVALPKPLQSFGKK